MFENDVEFYLTDLKSRFDKIKPTEIRDRILKNSDIVLYPKISKIQDDFIDRYQRRYRSKLVNFYRYYLD